MVDERRKTVRRDVLVYGTCALIVLAGVVATLMLVQSNDRFGEIDSITFSNKHGVEREVVDDIAIQRFNSIVNHCQDSIIQTAPGATLGPSETAIEVKVQDQSFKLYLVGEDSWRYQSEQGQIVELTSPEFEGFIRFLFVDEPLTLEEAVHVATAAYEARGGQPGSRVFSAERKFGHERFGEHWSVGGKHVPAMPGGHCLVIIDLQGNVVRYIGGA